MTEQAFATDSQGRAMVERWEQTTLGVQVDLLTGFPFKSKRYTDAANGIRLIRGDNIVQGATRYCGESLCYFFSS